MAFAKAYMFASHTEDWVFEFQLRQFKTSETGSGSSRVKCSETVVNVTALQVWHDEEFPLINGHEHSTVLPLSSPAMVTCPFEIFYSFYQIAINLIYLRNEFFNYLKAMTTEYCFKNKNFCLFKLLFTTLMLI